MGMTQRRFQALWRRCLPAGDAADGADVYRRLRAHYREPHRHYHTAAHIGHCLRQFDIVGDDLADADAVEAAIWFHDVIYCPQADDNERRSAEYFAAKTAGRVGGAFRQRVQDLILITMHAGQAADRDQAYMLDIDLSSFGLPWADYLRDSLAVREESAFMPAAEFYARRVVFLESLLARPAIFSTVLFRGLYERPARHNMERQLAQIRAESRAS
jgi:predicted metal-dependent HD superfamily phosphohydrolase